MGQQQATSASEIARLCRICGGEFGRELNVREMMFGTRETFRYRQCSECECLQIEAIPQDIYRFYGKNYYSYDAKRHKKWKRRRRGARRRVVITGPWLAMALLRLFSSPDPVFRIYREMAIRLNYKLLDVGAGSGGHVLELRDAGLAGAVGLDPFIEEDIIVDGKILVYQRPLEEMTGAFDLITFHHSLEHMPNQLNALTEARRLLAPRGRVLVRIPTVSSEAFETYRENWVNLDAPRHFFLHSHKSLKLVAARAGLTVDRLWCDSTDMQFMASEQYLHDIPLMDERSVAINRRSGMFSSSQRREYANKAERVNHLLRGDCICAEMSAAESRTENG